MAKATHASDATAAHRRRISGMTRPLMNGVPPSASVSRSTVLAWAVVAAFTSGAEAAASSGSGKRWLNSRVTASGSSPMPSAYARMKARRKMAGGHLETSARSRRDHPNDAVAFRKYVELTGRVGRDVGVGPAFAGHEREARQARLLAAARVVGALDDREHRVVDLSLPPDLHLVHRRHRARIAVVGGEHLLEVGVPDVARRDVGEDVLVAKRGNHAAAIDEAGADGVAAARFGRILDDGVRRHARAGGY